MLLMPCEPVFIYPHPRVLKRDLLSAEKLQDRSLLTNTQSNGLLSCNTACILCSMERKSWNWYWIAWQVLLWAVLWRDTHHHVLFPHKLDSVTPVIGPLLVHYAPSFVPGLPMYFQYGRPFDLWCGRCDRCGRDDQMLIWWNVRMVESSCKSWYINASFMPLVDRDQPPLIEP